MEHDMTFEELVFVSRPNALNKQATHDFANGYGVSVIIGPYTYGGEDGLYELAVMKGGDLCYDTPITDDVLGHLTPADVTRLLGDVEALPAVSP
jgi:hypothetical protein